MNLVLEKPLPCIFLGYLSTSASANGACCLIFKRKLEDWVDKGDNCDLSQLFQFLFEKPKVFLLSPSLAQKYLSINHSYALSLDLTGKCQQNLKITNK